MGQPARRQRGPQRFTQQLRGYRRNDGAVRSLRSARGRTQQDHRAIKPQVKRHPRIKPLRGPRRARVLRNRVVAVGTAPPKLFARRDRHRYERFDRDVTSNRP